MKYIKSFKLYENEDLPDVALDIFDLWNKISLTSFNPLSWPDKIYWSRGDEIDRPDDHVVTYYMEGEDNDLGFTWFTSGDVIDDIVTEIDYSYMEISDSSIDVIIKQYLIPFLKKLDSSIEYVSSDDYIKTKITWDQFVNSFKKIEEGPDQNGIRVEMTFSSSDGQEKLKIKFKKLDDQPPYFTV